MPVGLMVRAPLPRPSPESFVTLRVPPLMVTLPVKVFAPERVSVPAPVLVRFPAPERIPAAARVRPELTLQVCEAPRMTAQLRLKLTVAALISMPALPKVRVWPA